MTTLADKLASNIDRLEAEAAELTEDQAVSELAHAISCTGVGGADADCWNAGYYMGLMRALEVLKDYDEEVV